MNKRVARFAGAILLIAVLLLSSCGGMNKYVIKGTPEADLSGAEVYGLYP
jgi:hypothetical protein